MRLSWVTLIGLVVATPWLAADRLSRQVKGGRDAEVAMFGVMLLRVSAVDVRKADDAFGAPSETPRCMLRFGQADGMVVLYDPKERRTVRIPAD